MERFRPTSHAARGGVNPTRVAKKLVTGRSQQLTRCADSAVVRRLSRDFSLVIIALLVGSIVTFGAGLFGLTRLDSDLQSVVSVNMPRLMTITDLRRRIRMMVVSENDHILEADPVKARAIAAEITAGSTAVGELFAKYEQYLLPEDADKWSALRADFAAWLELDGRVLALSTERRTAEAAALSRTHSKQWESLIKSLIGNAEKQLQHTTGETFRVSRTARLTLIVVFGLSTLLGVIAGLFIYRGIRRTVGEVVSLKDRLIDANAGLERTVDERTRTIRAILDHVHFGFFLVGRELRITDGYTRSLSELLRRDQLAGERAAECLGFTGDRAADFEFRVEQIFDDLLPEELNCDQVPDRTVIGDRILRIQVSAVRDATGAVSQVLFGISDVTELEAAERANRNNRPCCARCARPTRSAASSPTSTSGSARRATRWRPPTSRVRAARSTRSRATRAATA